MNFTRLYSGNDGQSHFEELPMTLVDAEVGKIAQSHDISTAIFGYVEDVKEFSWHNSANRQYVIMLKGSIEIEIGDGSTTTLHEGDILLAEDLEGNGHISRISSDGPWQYLALPLADQ